MKITTLKPREYHTFYATYLSKVPKEVNLLDAYKNGKTQVLNFFESISEEKFGYRYAEGKWSIKEVFQHIIDNERIFTYRCLRIARQDKTPLPDYDQNIYIEPSNADKKTIKNLIREYDAVRENSIVLLESLSEENLNSLGQVSGGPMSARAAAFITIGHEMHHVNIIKERYL